MAAALGGHAREIALPLVPIGLRVRCTPAESGVGPLEKSRYRVGYGVMQLHRERNDSIERWTPPAIRRLCNKANFFGCVSVGIGVLGDPGLQSSTRINPVFVALLALALALMLFFVVKWIRLRRSLFHLAKSHDFEICPDCHYSLKGLGSEGRCPECGNSFVLNETVAQWKHYLLR